MRLDHQFTVPAAPDVVWPALLDLPRVAPCMPGATLTDVDGEAFTGTVKVKLGPVSLTYGGQGRFVTVDEAAHQVVIEASGKESRGSGTASATVSATLTATGSGTTVDVGTDLTITGRPAQFGRGMLNDVGDRLLGQFAACLAERLAEPPAAVEPSMTEPQTGEPVAPEATGAEVTRAERADVPPSTVDSPSVGDASDVEPIDILEITGVRDKIRRYAPIVAVAVLVVVVLIWLIA